VLRQGDEAQGSQAAPVLGLTRSRWIIDGVRLRDGDGRRLAGAALGVADGRVAAIGSAAAVRRRLGRGAERLGFANATALPGLVDPHVHVTGMAAREVELDCGPARTARDVLRAVRAWDRRLPPGEWVRGNGLDESGLDRLPTAAELERAAPGRPVRLRHRSRHASVLSIAALGRVRGRVPAGALSRDGLVTGREAALARAMGPLPDGALVEGLRAVAATLLRRGVTCVGDASPRSRRGARRLADLLVAAGFAPHVVGMGTAAGAPWPPDARVPCAAVKIVVEDDADGMRPRPSTLRRMIHATARRGQRVAVHCVTLGTLVAALDAFASLPARHRRGRGHRLEHVGECPLALVREIARLDLGVVSNPAFLYWRGDAYLAERSVPADWLYPVGSLVRAGVPVAAASDAPVTPCDPFGAMAAARSRRTRDGVVLGARDRVGGARALGLVCRAAAIVVGQRDLGRLRTGGVADIVVVDRDPVARAAEAVRETRVLCTMIGGEVAWHA
jgi:predicted amidohydrolase YtcJ